MTIDLSHIDDVEKLRDLERKVAERIKELQEQGVPALLARLEADAKRLGLNIEDVINGAGKRKRRSHAAKDDAHTE
jgi:hypothetical protein